MMTAKKERLIPVAAMVHVALILNSQWAILWDENQWIVAKARKRGIQSDFKPRWYIGSNKTTLLRVLRENEVSLNPNALSQLEAWPERFLEWLSWWAKLEI